MRLYAQAEFYRRNIRVGAISLNSNGETEEQHIEPTRYTTIDDVCSVIESIELYAKQAIKIERAKVRPITDKARNMGKAALQTWINDLAGLWFDIFGVPPGTSVNQETQSPGGPFIRFVMACYAPLVRNTQTLPKLTASAVRAHFRKTERARLKRSSGQ